MNEIRKRLDNRMPLTWRQGVLLVSEVERLTGEVGQLKQGVLVRQLRDVVQEACEYLGTNKLTNIAHGSILHRKLISVLAESV